MGSSALFFFLNKLITVSFSFPYLKRWRNRLGAGRFLQRSLNLPPGEGGSAEPRRMRGGTRSVLLLAPHPSRALPGPPSPRRGSCLLRVYGNALFSKVLGSALVEGGGHAGGGVLQAQLRALAVFLGDVGGIVEDGRR